MTYTYRDLLRSAEDLEKRVEKVCGQLFLFNEFHPISTDGLDDAGAALLEVTNLYRYICDSNMLFGKLNELFDKLNEGEEKYPDEDKRNLDNLVAKIKNLRHLFCHNQPSKRFQSFQIQKLSDRLLYNGKVNWRILQQEVENLIPNACKQTASFVEWFERLPQKEQNEIIEKWESILLESYRNENYSIIRFHLFKWKDDNGLSDEPIQRIFMYLLNEEYDTNIEDSFKQMVYNKLKDLKECCLTEHVAFTLLPYETESEDGTIRTSLVNELLQGFERELIYFAPKIVPTLDSSFLPSFNVPSRGVDDKPFLPPLLDDDSSDKIAFEESQPSNTDATALTPVFETEQLSTTNAESESPYDDSAIKKGQELLVCFRPDRVSTDKKTGKMSVQGSTEFRGVKREAFVSFQDDILKYDKAEIDYFGDPSNLCHILEECSEISAIVCNPDDPEFNKLFLSIFATGLPLRTAIGGIQEESIEGNVNPSKIEPSLPNLQKKQIEVILKDNKNGVFRHNGTEYPVRILDKNISPKEKKRLKPNTVIIATVTALEENGIYTARFKQFQ